MNNGQATSGRCERHGHLCCDRCVPSEARVTVEAVLALITVVAVVIGVMLWRW